MMRFNQRPSEREAISPILMMTVALSPIDAPLATALTQDREAPNAVDVCRVLHAEDSSLGVGADRLVAPGSEDEALAVGGRGASTERVGGHRDECVDCLATRHG